MGGLSLQLAQLMAVAGVHDARLGDRARLQRLGCYPPAPGLPGATWCGWPARSYSRCCASKSGRIVNPAQRLLAQHVCTAANNVTEVINTACIHYQKLPAARPLGIGGNAGQTTGENPIGSGSKLAFLATDEAGMCHRSAIVTRPAPS